MGESVGPNLPTVSILPLLLFFPPQKDMRGPEPKLLAEQQHTQVLGKYPLQKPSANAEQGLVGENSSISSTLPGQQQALTATCLFVVTSYLKHYIHPGLFTYFKFLFWKM